MQKISKKNQIVLWGDLERILTNLVGIDDYYLSAKFQLIQLFDSFPSNNSVVLHFLPEVLKLGSSKSGFGNTNILAPVRTFSDFLFLRYREYLNHN